MQRPASDSEVAALDRIAAAREDEAVRSAQDAARDRLGMDAAYVTRIDSEAQYVEEVAGDSTSLVVPAGTRIPIEQTYCRRMLAGELPNVIPDTSAEPRVRDLPATRRIGAYVGVPVELADGRLHGTLCAVSPDAKHELGEDDLRFMRVLAKIVGELIDRNAAHRPA